MKQDSDLTRQERISKTFQQRRKNLCLVLDNLSEELNISAILRSAEGFGVGEVVILHSKEKTPKLSKNTSKGAIKWLNLTFATNATKELNRLKKSGFAIVATIVDPQAEKVWAVDFAGKIALVVGNEAVGVSEEVKALVDKMVYLPMSGLTESYNVSVATAIALYEIVRQQEKNG